MNQWTTNKDIINLLLKKWERGDILNKSEEYIFPLKIKLKSPNKSELTSKYLEVFEWINNLKNNEKSKKGYGYILEQKEVNFRDIGKNVIPTHIILENINDVVKLIKKEEDYEIFIKNKLLFLKFSTDLEPWIFKYPLKLIDKVSSDVSSYITVFKWFKQNPNHYIYIRQFNIPGVDTKFIEKNKKFISEILDIILPKEEINFEESIFEKRYKIKGKTPMIRMRLLDATIFNTFSDMSVRIDEFSRWNPDFKYIFFLENEINYLSFPNVKNALCIFSKGYNVEILRDVNWLKEKEIFYWGDIDTRGFNILSIVRSFLPQTKSF